ncbi:hypothetical protein [Actinacidiphila yanglinensis]|uniref:hypothetical protein n=1 Tax=Actinacidiphila yanglinensis TaxID=310779 RepID=UPI0011B01F16|nr:hypothetical protein [Actinacidiphila yanglinensis]
MAGLTAACDGHKNSEGRVGDHYTVLATYVTGGVHWQLDAFRDANGSFCMGINGPKGPDATANIPWVNAACGFDDSDSGGYYGGGDAPGKNAFVSYGPLPGKAVGVRVSTKEVVPTKPLPKGHDLPDGRYWIFYQPASWPGKGAKAVEPQPLDASGRKVAFKKF